MLRPIALIAVLSMPLPALAAGDSDNAPPKPTQTTEDCFKARQWDPETKRFVRFSQPVNGVWDARIRKCVRPDKTSYLGDDTLLDAVRELAYAGRYQDAATVLDQMSDQRADGVLTYRGFVARKLGQLELADLYYRSAIAANPDNILARSYMGQGKAAAGDRVAALSQLREIRNRGGAGTWAEAALRTAIEKGIHYNY